MSSQEPPRIQRLTEAVVNRIAAGEVIQRPASALKEMLENSIDAGATSILAEDLPILCERHTTSKLQEYSDLLNMSTLGFRGEALASISFVAHLSVTTMMVGAPHANRVSYKDGIMLPPGPVPCAGVKGTTLVVEDLFYNVPTRRKALRAPSEEYARILDVMGRYAVFKNGVSFSCKKQGESGADIHTSACKSHLDSIRQVYGNQVARNLISITLSKRARSSTAAGGLEGKEREGLEDGDDGDFTLDLDGLISNANYVAKKTTFILFINGRLVESPSLKKALEAVYASILPKAARPFVYLSLSLPPAEVDVNVHPTKKEVNFLNHEKVVEAVQQLVEASLLNSNSSRTFATQSLLPGASQPLTGSNHDTGPKNGKAPTKPAGMSQKTLEYKLVRTDAKSRKLEAFADHFQGPSDDKLRRVRQRKSLGPLRACDLTSIQELLAAVDAATHRGLTEVVQKHVFVGVVDDTFVAFQHGTKLFVGNVLALSQELVYQQVLRRFSQFPPLALSEPANVRELLVLALDAEEVVGNWDPSDGGKEEIAEVTTQLLLQKAELLQEYFTITLTPDGMLTTLPVILEQYLPDLGRLPQFMLALGNEVCWDSEKECFHSIALELAQFYGLHPRPPEEQAEAEVQTGGSVSQEDDPPGQAKDPHDPRGQDEPVLTTKEGKVVECEDGECEQGKGKEGTGKEGGDEEGTGNAVSAQGSHHHHHEHGTQGACCGEGDDGDRTGAGAQGGDEGAAGDGPTPGRGDPAGSSAAGEGDSGKGGEGQIPGKKAECARQGQVTGGSSTHHDPSQARSRGSTQPPPPLPVATLQRGGGKVSAERDWVVQYVLFPAMRLFLKPPISMATDGTVVQVACLEKLYKIFERC
eukprot:jgi/Mesvir1/912/Mv17473-RA.2